MNTENKKIKRGKKRKAIKAEKEAFKKFFVQNCIPQKKEIENIVSIKEPRSTNDIGITIGLIFLIILFCFLIWNKKIDFVPGFMKVVFFVLGLELLSMMINLWIVNVIYYVNSESNWLIKVDVGKRQFYYCKFFSRFLGIVTMPWLVFNAILKILGLDTLKNYYGTYVFAITIPLMPSLLISEVITEKVLNKSNNIFVESDIYIWFIIMLLMEFVFIYLITRFSFYIVNYEDYLDDRKHKDREFNRLWRQMKIIIYLFSMACSFTEKINENALFSIFMSSLTFVMMIDTFFTKCKEQNAKSESGRER